MLEFIKISVEDEEFEERQHNLYNTKKDIGYDK